MNKPYEKPVIVKLESGLMNKFGGQLFSGTGFTE